MSPDTLSGHDGRTVRAVVRTDTTVHRVSGVRCLLVERRLAVAVDQGEFKTKFWRIAEDADAAV